MELKTQHYIFIGLGIVALIGIGIYIKKRNATPVTTGDDKTNTDTVTSGKKKAVKKKSTTKTKDVTISGSTIDKAKTVANIAINPVGAAFGAGFDWIKSKF